MESGVLLRSRLAAEASTGGRRCRRSAPTSGRRPYRLGDADLVFVHGHIVVLKKHGAECLIVGQDAAVAALADPVGGPDP